MVLNNLAAALVRKKIGMSISQSKVAILKSDELKTTFLKTIYRNLMTFFLRNKYYMYYVVYNLILLKCRYNNIANIKSIKLFYNFVF